MFSKTKKASLLTASTLLMSLGVMGIMRGCGGKDSENVGGTPPPAAGACSPVGTTKTDACPTGFTGSGKVFVCQATGFSLISDNCLPSTPPPGGGTECTKVTFEEDVKPVIQASCVSCHVVPGPYTDYATAKGLARDMANRVNLPTDNIQRMPPFPKAELELAQKKLFSNWVNDGLLKDNAECTSGNVPSGRTFSLDYIETEILDDLSRQANVNDRINSRYLVMSDKMNSGASAESLKRYVAGLNKAINSLSLEDDLVKVSPVDDAQTIFRIDLRTYGQASAFWDSVERVDPIKFESFTTKGLQIKNLAGTEKPWLHADNFTFAAHGGYDQSVYYNALKLPTDENQFLRTQGVNKADALRKFEATYAGGFGSPISINKNRLISRFETNEGYLWFTYDPVELGAGVQIAKRNFFNFPLDADIDGAIAKFDYDAGEAIFTLPNGLQGYILFNAAGVRQNFAPLNIVRDNETPFDPTIVNAFSCARCHQNGLIPMQDQIRDSVIQNGAQFNRNDVEIVKALYKGKAALAATFINDTRVYTDALKVLGIDVNDPVEPQNFLTDSMRKDMTMNEVAGKLFLSPDEFKEQLSGAAVSRQKVGQLLNGGTIGFTQFLDAMPDFIREFRLGQDPINP